MDEKKWEDLNFDCLVNILGRVGMESLLLDVPFVCQTWYKATLEPQCWKKLVFPKLVSPWSDDGRFSWRLFTEFFLTKYVSFSTLVKVVIKRSNGSATFVELPSCCTEVAFRLVANKCPNLRTLLLPKDLSINVMLLVPTFISKWKKLENLRLHDCGDFKGETFPCFKEQILPNISIHCKNFVSLAVPRAYIGEEEASAIATFLPSIKKLRLTNASMAKKNLLIILQGCKELEFLDIRGCIGFDAVDDEILKLASHIRTLKLEGLSSTRTCRRGQSLFDDTD